MPTTIDVNLKKESEMNKNIAAFTATNKFYPEYISINRLDHGYVEITIRGAAMEGMEGDVVSITLSSTEFNALIGEMLISK